MPATSRSFLQEYVLRVVRSIRRIAVFCLLIAVATAVYSLVVEERYTVYSLVMVPQGQGTAGMGALASIAGRATGGGLGLDLGDMLGTPSSPDIDLAFQVMTSRMVMEELIGRYDLMTVLKVPHMERAVEKLGRRINVSITPEGFIGFSIQGWTPEKTAAMARDLIEISNDRLDSLVTCMTRRARIEAGENMRTAEDSLRVAMQALSDFRASTGVILPEGQATQAVTIIAGVERLLVEAEAELAGVTASISPTSATALSILRRVDVLKRALELRIGGGDSLSAMPGLEETPELLRRYEELAIEVETRRAVYLLVRQEYERLLLDEARESPMLEVLVPPVPPALRSYPLRKNMVIKNTMLALAVALAWVLVVTYFSRFSRSRTGSRFLGEVSSELKNQLCVFRRR